MLRQQQVQTRIVPPQIRNTIRFCELRGSHKDTRQTRVHFEAEAKNLMTCRFCARGNFSGATLFPCGLSAHSLLRSAEKIQQDTTANPKDCGASISVAHDLVRLNQIPLCIQRVARSWIEYIAVAWSDLAHRLPIPSGSCSARSAAVPRSGIVLG